MSTQDFIFSDNLKHRLSRHVVFWLTLYVFLLLTATIPGHLFPNWQIEYNKVFLEMKGGLSKRLLNMVMRQTRFLALHMIFTYALLYYLLPIYFNQKKNWFSATVLVLMLFIALQCCQYLIIYQGQIQARNQLIKAGLSLPKFQRDTAERIRVVLFSVTFNLSIIVGFAVAIKLIKLFWFKLKETEELAREKVKAELQLLKAQIHPHFLFNTLNNIYYFTLNASPHAPLMIKKLTGMLHYILHECDLALVPLDKELKMLEDYITLERIRYTDRLKMTTTIQGDSKHKLIAPLLLIPFVENTFKHGASKMITQAEIKMEITVEGNELTFFIRNSKPIPDESTSRQVGLGLKNVKKRLLLLCPGKHDLKIISEPGSFTVLLNISLQEINISDTATTMEQKQPFDYAMA